MDKFTRRTGPPATRRQRNYEGGWQWWTKQVAFYTLVAAVVGFVGVQMFTKIYQPYMKHWTAAAKFYQEHYVYLTNPDGFCIDTPGNNAMRTKIKGLDKCDDAETVVNSWVFWMAFGRLIDDFDICKDGCFQVKFDLLSSLGLIFMVFVSFMILLLLLVCGGLFVYAYRTMQTDFGLPSFIPAIDRAATLARHQQREVEIKLE